MKKAGMSETQAAYGTESEAAREARLDAEAVADHAAGRVVPHERVRVWLGRLARGERVPPPEA